MTSIDCFTINCYDTSTFKLENVGLFYDLKDTLMQISFWNSLSDYYNLDLVFSLGEVKRILYF